MLEKNAVRQNIRSFTLIELIVVVIVIGILASIVMPNYVRARERAVDKQAIAILAAILAAEKNYKMDMGNYYPSTGTVTNSDIININSNLSLDLVDDGNWCYTIGWNVATWSAILLRVPSKNGGYFRLWWINSTMANAICQGYGGSSCP